MGAWREKETESIPLVECFVVVFAYNDAVVDVVVGFAADFVEVVVVVVAADVDDVDVVEIVALDEMSTRREVTWLFSNKPLHEIFFFIFESETQNLFKLKKVYLNFKPVEGTSLCRRLSSV